MFVRGTDLLGKGTSIVAKEFKEGVGVGLHVELHLPLLDNLQKGGGSRGKKRLRRRYVPRTCLLKFDVRSRSGGRPHEA